MDAVINLVGGILDRGRDLNHRVVMGGDIVMSLNIDMLVDHPRGKVEIILGDIDLKYPYNAISLQRFCLFPIILQ
jgi:hypothetical protein